MLVTNMKQLKKAMLQMVFMLNEQGVEATDDTPLQIGLVNERIGENDFFVFDWRARPPAGMVKKSDKPDYVG